MKSHQASISELVVRLSGTVDAFIQFYLQKQDTPFSPRESVVIRHIAFWHPYYAAVVSAIATHTPPPLFNETYNSLYDRSLQELAPYTSQELLGRIRQAQTKLATAIVHVPADTYIPYKQGSKPYLPTDYLDVIERHTRNHLDELCKLARKQKALPRA